MSSFRNELKRNYQLIVAVAFLTIVITAMAIGIHSENCEIAKFSDDPRLEVKFQQIDNLLATDKEKHKIKLDLVRQVKEQDKRQK